MSSWCKRRFRLSGSPPVVLGSRALNCGPDMAVMIEDSLHHMRINQPVLYFSYHISKAFDFQLVDVGFLLIMSLE
jgi:hypothetical protein